MLSCWKSLRIQALRYKAAVRDGSLIQKQKGGETEKERQTVYETIVWLQSSLLLETYFPVISREPHFLRVWLTFSHP